MASCRLGSVVEALGLACTNTGDDILLQGIRLDARMRDSSRPHLGRMTATGASS
jgi:hypothetical protein